MYARPPLATSLFLVSLAWGCGKSTSTDPDRLTPITGPERTAFAAPG